MPATYTSGSLTNQFVGTVGETLVQRAKATLAKLETMSTLNDDSSFVCQKTSFTCRLWRAHGCHNAAEDYGLVKAHIPVCSPAHLMILTLMACYRIPLTCHTTGMIVSGSNQPANLVCIPPPCPYLVARSRSIPIHFTALTPAFVMGLACVRAFSTQQAEQQAGVRATHQLQTVVHKRGPPRAQDYW